MKTVKSLPEIRIAETLPMPVKNPPQMSGLRFGGEPEGPGIINDATLFPASLAPFAKASANRAASPNSSIDTIKRRVPGNELYHRPLILTPRRF